jgi:DNA mismatch repair protein MutL
LGELCWFKQDINIQSAATDFSFETEEVTAYLTTKRWSTLFKTYIKFIKKYIVSPIKSGMVIVDQQRAHQRVL